MRAIRGLAPCPHHYREERDEEQNAAAVQGAGKLHNRYSTAGAAFRCDADCFGSFYAYQRWNFLAQAVFDGPGLSAIRCKFDTRPVG